jgi:hypothetical protein
MSHENEKENADIKRWLSESHPLPRLEDTSLSVRKAFLVKHEDVLWSFWRDAFSIAIAGGAIDPKRALGARVTESGHVAEEISDRLIKALGTRPEMDSIPAWENLERWYAWLIGAVAARERKLPAHKAPRDNRGDEAREDLLDLRHLVDRWVRVLGSLVERTGIRAIELDWLWATCRVRRRLPESLGEGDWAARLLNTNLRATIASSSAPGSSRGERIARTRDGAAACLRFNIEELATRRGFTSTPLLTAREVFVGPASPEPPYRPRAPLDDSAVAGFREALLLSGVQARLAPDDGEVDRLRKDVFRCALKKAVLRLLSRKLGDALQTESSLWEDADASNEEDEP